MSGSGREILPDVRECRETLMDVREWSGDPPKCPGGLPGCSPVAVKPPQMSGSGRKALLDIREWWVAFKDVREWTGGPPGCPIVVGESSRMSGIGREAFPDVRE